MTAEEWKTVESIFHAALDLPEQQRESFLQSECPDTRLRLEVQHLLASITGSGFLEQPALPSARGVIDFAAQSENPEQQQEPSRQKIGPYVPVRVIGRGGMGIVYEAFRQEGDFRQTVALKVLTTPVLDPDHVRLFRLERQALGQLDHSGIARLLDWGLTDEGYPYLVMEFVADGLPIDRYCQTHQLRLSEVLALFLQVCYAVAHAHRNLVVHRDLKPANVLVNGQGQVKLLDFGIAKLLDSRDGNTLTVNLRLTPAYASPEQIRGEAITTATDVYSLGVLLCELLTGSVPYTTTNSRADELAWSVVTQEPRRPSAIEGITAQRRKELTGDLDWIVLTALRKEPERRYSSVEGLAGDIRNYLAGRPVVARGDAWSYRARKFIQRNRVAAAALAIGAISLIGGTTVALWREGVAQRERAVAERHFRDLQKLSHSLIFDINDSIQHLNGATEARSRLVSTAVNYLDALRREAPEDDSVQIELAAAYERLGNLEGGYSEEDLGDPGAALQSFLKVHEILLPLWSKHPFDAGIGTPLFESAAELAMTYVNPQDGENALSPDLPLVAEWAASRPNDPAALRAASYAFMRGAQVARSMGKLGLAAERLDQAQSAARKLLASRPSDPLTWYYLYETTFHRAREQTTRGDYAAALKTYEQADQYHVRRTTLDATDAVLNISDAVTAGRWAELLAQSGQVDAGMNVIRRSLRTITPIYRNAPNYGIIRNDMAMILHGRAAVFAGRRQWREALEDSRQAVELLMPLAKSAVPTRYAVERYAEASNRYGTILRSAGRREDARSTFESALPTTELALKRSPTNIELLRARARARGGLGLVALDLSGSIHSITYRQVERESAIRYLRESADDWHELRQRSPLDREGLEEQESVEAILSSLRENASKP